MRATIFLMVGVFLVGCGSSSTSDPGGGTPAPTVHGIDAGAKRVAASSSLTVALGSLPAGATVTYDIVDMPTGFGVDTMDFSIASDSVATRANQGAYGVRSGVSSTGATTPALAADNYDLIVACHNASDDCLFTSTVNATY